LRLDKWLWQARFCKTRADAADLISDGHIRVNGTPMAKPGHGVAVNDVLTLPHGGVIRLIRIVALGVRRGPSTEAHSLYIDMEQRRDAPSPLE
jgi:ribosome-associated heat shock protein Hsp15